MTGEPETSRHWPVRPDWLALHTEEILDPGLPIVDPHHHVWDRQGWSYMLPDLLADLGSGHDIRATMFMQCESMYRQDGDPDLFSLGETEFANGIGAIGASGTYGPCRIAAGIVGHVDLRLGDRARSVLERHVAAAGGRFRGVRNISAWHADPAARGSTATPPSGLLADRAFRDGYAALEPLGLVFDAFMYHTQLSEVLDLASAFPGTRIVINHVGGPIGIGPYAGRRDEVFRAWQAAIRELARAPNVSMKLGGFGMRLFNFEFVQGPRPSSSEDLARAWGPYAAACIDAFGADRCMFESNFPVDKASCSYSVMWNAFKRIAAGYSADEKRGLFGGNACRIYGLDVPGFSAPAPNEKLSGFE